jgi:tRNA(His) guanylyltransferase
VSKHADNSLGARIKRYEAAYDHRFTPRSCLFVRVDGKAFHTFTRHCARPFDQNIVNAMEYAMYRTSREMQGFKLAYAQSDECTFVLTDFDTHQTQGWFGYELNKVVSLTASMFTAYFNDGYGTVEKDPALDYALFDARAFIVPIDDAPNVFIWRQQDWERNSVQMLTRAHFSHKQCERKRIPDMHEMLHGVGVNWAHLDPQLKNGTYLTRDGKRVYEKWDYETIAAQILPAS